MDFSNLYGGNFKRNVRIWSGRMEPHQLEEISNEIQFLHKSMKNLMEVAFATSPLLALSTHGWRQKSFNGTYLLRVGDISAVYSCAHLRSKDLLSPWQQPSSNPSPAGRLCPSGNHRHFRGQATRPCDGFSSCTSFIFGARFGKR